MLAKLTVKNFALIENAVLNFGDGFTVITGETGSGKSIMLGALRMILGERADHNVIRDKSLKTVVEGVFDLSNLDLKHFFENNDVDYEKETIVRREINAKGKSRAFVNDTPVQLSTLKALTSFLINIHSQHHTIQLKSKAFQLQLLDVWCENSVLLDTVKEHYNEYQQIISEIAQLKEQLVSRQKELEFNKFQLEELYSLNLASTDYTKIEQDFKRAEQFDKIKASFQLITDTIDEGEGVSYLLNQIKKNSFTDDPKLEALLNRIEATRIELTDISAVANDELLDLESDPIDINELIPKLDAFNAALKKHFSSTQKELLEVQRDFELKIDNSEGLEHLIIEKEKAVENVKKILDKKAKELSKKRAEGSKSLGENIVSLLSDLKLPEAKLEFKLSEKGVTQNGADDLTMLFTPNKGMAPQSIEKAASGGELSRLMLVIHYLLSQKMQLPTVIFDEIDTGVSGEVAHKIGQHLRRMGEQMQLLAITHLPQVASKGANHIKVRKRDVNDQTITFFETLDNQARINEIAQLMSGAEINEAALSNAEKLMQE